MKTTLILTAALAAAAAGAADARQTPNEITAQLNRQQVQNGGMPLTSAVYSQNTVATAQSTTITNASVTPNSNTPQWSNGTSGTNGDQGLNAYVSPDDPTGTMGSNIGAGPGVTGRTPAIGQPGQNTNPGNTGTDGNNSF